jgi:hypothetical protein
MNLTENSFKYSPVWQYNMQAKSLVASLFRRARSFPQRLCGGLSNSNAVFQPMFAGVIGIGATLDTNSP